MNRSSNMMAFCKLSDDFDIFPNLQYSCGNIDNSTPDTLSVMDTKVILLYNNKNKFVIKFELFSCIHTPCLGLFLV